MTFKDVVVVLWLIAGCGGGSKPASQGMPPLHTEGRFFKDDTGQTVILRGVAFADLKELDTARAPMNIARLIDLVSDESQGWYARVVRLTVYPQDWRPDPDGYFEQYLKPAVDRATQRRLYAIVDWHEIGDAAPADAETRQFWAKAAPAFASYTNVLFEVFNESEDLTDPSWALWKATAQPWVDQIRRDAPNNVILIGAPFWTQAVGGAATDPFTGDNLAYVGHIYPVIDRSLWSAGGGFTQVAATRPMMITEWGFRASGTSPVTGDQSSFGDPLKAYIEEQRLGWTAWCADTIWASEMFDPSWNLLVGPSEMGGFTKDWLAEKKNDDQPAKLLRGTGVSGSGGAGGSSGGFGGSSGGSDGSDAGPSDCTVHGDSQSCAAGPGCVWLEPDCHHPFITAPGCFGTPIPSQPC